MGQNYGMKNCVIYVEISVNKVDNVSHDFKYKTVFTKVNFITINSHHTYS